jgi:DNA-binding protein HU-beta
MNLAEFVVAVAQETGFGKGDAEKSVRGVFDTVRKTLAKGEEIKIAGFGQFEVTKRGPRKGRNLRTGEALEIPAMQVVRFQAGKQLKDAINTTKPKTRRAPAKKAG